MNGLVIAYSILFLVIVMDLLFYIPLQLHFYLSRHSIYVSFFTIPLLVISKTKTINRFKNKIDIEKLKQTKKEDLKIIESFNLSVIRINITQKLLKEYSGFFYMFHGLVTALDEVYLNNKLILTSNEDKKDYLYVKVDLTLVKFLEQFFAIRRMKHERASIK